jgi:HAD superfamily hydrolase (TIGR01549 family)
MLANDHLLKQLKAGSIRGIIFDFDGTILDIREPLKKSIEEVYEAKNINANIDDTIEEIGALMETIQGYPLPKILLESYDMFKYITSLQSLTFFKKLEIAIKIFTKYLTYAKDAPLYPNTTEILKKLKKSFDLFIVSHNQTRNVIEHLEKEEITSLFKAVYGADILPALKPDPIALRPIFESYKSCKLQEFIMVGDMPSDIESGREAGVWTVGIASGVSSKKTLTEFKPDVLVESLSEFLKIIEQKKVTNSNSRESLKIKS